MKKTAFCALFALCLTALCLAGAPAFAEAPEAPIAPIEAEAAAAAVAPEACADAADVLAPAPVEQAVIRPLPHCGDYCYTPGAAQGCIDWQGHRTQCYCSSYNNTWTCGPY